MVHRYMPAKGLSKKEMFVRAKIRSFLDQSRRGAFVAGAIFALAFAPIAAHAENYTYGSGVYGADSYNGSQTSSGGTSAGSSGGGTTTPTSGSPDKESTVVKTPSGLEVAINLANGQAIPSTGYYITITPINSDGKTFDKAEIYLDGKLMFTGAPDATGTLKWLWETSKYPASKVKIIIFGPGDSQSVHEFDVIVTPVQSGVTTQNTDAETLPQTAGWPVWVMVVLGIVFVLVVMIVWLLLKRRHDKQLPPPMFPPTQTM